MDQIREIAVACFLLACLFLAFTDATKQQVSVVDSSNLSSTKSFSAISDETERNTEAKIESEEEIGRKWKSMETVFRNILAVFYNESLPFICHVNNNLDISRNCKRDLMKMLTGIKEAKYWAVQMLDSFGKLHTGFATGSTYAFGDYNQCLEVDVPAYFQGQFCNLDLILPLPKREPFIRPDTKIPELMKVLQPDTFMALFTKYGRFFQFIHPRVSICVPSTCSKEELQNIANEAVQAFNLSVGLHISNCEILKKEIKFDRVEITIMFILGSLLFLVISSTALEFYLKTACNEEEYDQSTSNLPTKYLLCFSLLVNTKLLLKSDVENDSIKIFHGLRFFTTLWVILVHTCLCLNYHVNGSLLSLYNHLGKLYFQFVANGFINVQIFFFMSGALHAFNAMKMKKKINIKKHILRRIWRLVPTFMLVIACVILIPHLGSGPVWKETIQDIIVEKCRARWWTNLLFINNFINCGDMCLPWLWYLPVDFQLYILSLFVIVPMKSHPRLAFTINFIIMIGAIVISAAFQVYYNLTPILVLAFPHPEDIDFFFLRGHTRPYLHCSSVCTGLAVGYFLAKRPSKLHIPQKISMLLWLTSFSACLAVTVGVSRWSEGYIPSIGISALYACGSKIIWSAGMAWLTIACTTGNGGIITKFLSLPIFVPLGRLCYMVYLIHTVFHYMYTGSTNVPIFMDSRTIVFMYCGTVLISFLSAFVLVLIFESPFLALGKLMFNDKTPERTKTLKGIESGKFEEMRMIMDQIVEEQDSSKKLD